ncbi:hypothetical protein P4O66_011202, partial [Electrophorus voltai]
MLSPSQNSLLPSFYSPGIPHPRTNKKNQTKWRITRVGRRGDVDVQSSPPRPIRAWAECELPPLSPLSALPKPLRLLSTSAGRALTKNVRFVEHP